MQEISFEFLVGSLFPNVLTNIKEALRIQHAQGYAEGLAEGKKEGQDEFLEYVLVEQLNVKHGNLTVCYLTSARHCLSTWRNPLQGYAPWPGAPGPDRKPGCARWQPWRQTSPLR